MPTATAPATAPAPPPTPTATATVPLAAPTPTLAPTATSAPPPALPAIKAVFVVAAKNATGLTQGQSYSSASITATIDPAKTRWVAWNNVSSLALTRPERPGAALLGPGGFGTDDYIDVTVTNPRGEKLTIALDKNDSVGRSSGPQNVIFGTAADAPDVYRQSPSFASPPGEVSIFNEGGTHNAIFTVAGEYRFDFSFINGFTATGGHQDVYLLVFASP